MLGLDAAGKTSACGVLLHGGERLNYAQRSCTSSS
jgi:hypothetical protein